MSKQILDKAAELGIKVYSYDTKSFQLVNGKPFRGLRETAKSLPINPCTLSNKMNTGKPWKDYFCPALWARLIFIFLVLIILVPSGLMILQYYKLKFIIVSTI